LGGLCKIGSALSCDDSNVCTADSCDPSAGCLHKPIAGSCNDGNACTDNDQCNAGSCAGSIKVCDDANPCSLNTCDPQAGCQYPDEADKTFCSADTKYWCEAGQCVVKILCGNGVIDAETNETCDDSNKTSWDGCSDKCISECWSLDLDGKKDVVTLPALNNDPAADQVTVELWLRFVIAPLGPATILSSDCMDLTWDGQVLRVETFAGCTGTGSGVTVDVPVGDAPTSWTHVAVQADNAGAVQVFLAGQPKAGPAVTPVPAVAGVHGTAIGARVVGGSGMTQFAPIRAMELRASKGWRYSGAFSPAYRFEPDLQTTALYHVLDAAGTAVAPAVSGQNGLVTGAVWLQDAPQCPAPAPCGNLQLDRAEVCDDGGIAKGDGCSASCHLEPVPSCKHIGYLFPYLKTGLYQIDPDGFDGPVEPETLWCELENNSPNNWTLVGNFYDSAGDDMPNETKYVASGWNQDGLGVGNVQKFSTGLAKPLDRVNTAQGSGAVSLAFIEAMAKVAGVKHLRMCFVGTDGKDTYCRSSNNPNDSMTLATATTVFNTKLKPFQSTALAYTFGRLAGLAASADGYDASLYSLGGFCIKRANAAEDVNSEPNFGKQSEGLCEHHNTTQGAWAGIWHGFGYGMSFKPWEKDDTELAAGTVSDGVNGLPIRANPSDKTWGFRLYVGGNVCGNGEEELGEACDDGNTKDGDTCPGNCGP
jgi:cysteine-rich repeat protein